MEDAAEFRRQMAGVQEERDRGIEWRARKQVKVQIAECRLDDADLDGLGELGGCLGYERSAAAACGRRQVRVY